MCAVFGSESQKNSGQKNRLPMSIAPQNALFEASFFASRVVVGNIFLFEYLPHFLTEISPQSVLLVIISIYPEPHVI